MLLSFSRRGIYCAVRSSLNKRNFSASPVMSATCLTLDKVNPRVIEMQYAVRGPIVARAGEIEKELAAGQKKPFTSVLRANIGDCHATGQQPITFLRQVLAICVDPTLLNCSSYPEDAKSRARDILESCRGHSMGAYTDSVGLSVVLKHVAQYIEQRDGFPADTSDIFLSNGASDSIKAILRLVMTTGQGKDRAGVLIPIPQYPLYTAALSEFGAVPTGYYLDEDNKWGLSTAELENAIKEARENSVPRAIVIINPGNPTGQVLTEDNIKEIIKFAVRENLVILADEVYQHNIYAEGAQFHSFKKVLRQLEKSGEIPPGHELASFMSVSKGYMGECGIRGGYCEAINFCPDVKAQLFKSISASLCSTTTGQAVLDVVMNPPKPGEPSYEQFSKEKDAVLQSLKDKAKIVSETFNALPGIKCNPVMGAMYCFPKLTLPQKAIEAAKAKNQNPDEFYCFELLENTGICVVPGSGFRQKPGTFHFRTTILPPLEMIRESMERFKKFHLQFLEKYA